VEVARVPGAKQLWAQDKNLHRGGAYYWAAQQNRPAGKNFVPRPAVGWDFGRVDWELKIENL
jgi:hypothetical protein